MKLRLPFALGLAMACVTLAVMRLWPFTPPGEATRTSAAAGDGAPEVLRPWLQDRFYRALEKPQAGEWLHSSPEWAQSVRAWQKSKPNLPDANRRVLYLMPLGDFPEGGRAPSLELLREYLGLYFGLEARLTPPEPESGPNPERRINGESGQPQLLTRDILRWLPGRLPADAYALLAVTLTDLYPKASWNFVFGEATYTERVGVFSLARNDPAFFIGGQTLPVPAKVRALILRRACLILSHETGHMFGWAHCRYYQCVMGGTGSQEESDRFPVGLCPVCLHKRYLAGPFDPLRRQQDLLEFYQRNGLTEDADQSRKLLEQVVGGP